MESFLFKWLKNTSCPCPNPRKKNHIFLDRSLSENFSPTIKMSRNKMLACALSILQVSHTVCRNTTDATLAVLTVSNISWILLQEKHLLTLIRCFFDLWLSCFHSQKGLYRISILTWHGHSQKICHFLLVSRINKKHVELTPSWWSFLS